MALIHRATLNPPKLTLLAGWLPHRPWFTAGGELRQLGAYRFDDPAGEVGLEAFVMQAGDGPVFHLPLTYRGAPLDGAEQFLVGTLEHSVLGTRWVYDGCGDPVWVTAAVTTILTAAPQAEELVDVDGELVPREPTVAVQGSGLPGAEVGALTWAGCRDDDGSTVVRADPYELVVVRLVGTEVATDLTLTGRWADSDPVTLAGVRRGR